MNETSRLSLLEAAMVVARRDITAILFSKAFFFFLIGPLFFLAISAGAGALTASAADSVAPPRLAVALPQADAEAFAEAHGRLSDLIRLPAIETVGEDAVRDTDALLSDKSSNFGAVLQGTLAEPRLSGTQGLLDDWSGDVALIAANASGTPTAYPEIALSPTTTSMADTRRANTGLATGALTLMFLLTMLLAGMVLSNLVEEKGNKIIEILAASIPMDAVFFGKLVAMLTISFVGIAVWGSVAGLLILTGGDALPDLAPPAVGWPLFVTLFLVYFAMAYLLIGSVYLAVGSMAPTVRDVQTIAMPATILQLLMFFLATFAMTDIGSPVEIFAVLFPLSSPFTMVARAAQEQTLWVHAAALGWQVLWVAIFVRTGATLFRRKVMHSGPAKVKQRRRPFWKRALDQAADLPS